MKKLFSIWMAAVFAIFLSSGLSQPVQAANSASIAGTVTTASGALNVRSSASTSGKIVASLHEAAMLPCFQKAAPGGRSNMQTVNMAMYMAII